MACATLKILVVEDEVLLGLEMESTLIAMGYLVVGPFTDFALALAAAFSDDIDFALLDFDLGRGKDSTPIAQALKERGVPFAFVTGTELSVVRASFAKSIVLPKPVDERLLGSVLAAA